MNSRRLNVAPEAQDNAAYQVEFAMSALGQKRTCAVQEGMSALPPKADVRPAFGASKSLKSLARRYTVPVERLDIALLTEEIVFPIITSTGPGNPACASRSGSSAIGAVTTA